MLGQFNLGQKKNLIDICSTQGRNPPPVPPLPSSVVGKQKCGPEGWRPQGWGPKPEIFVFFFFYCPPLDPSSARPPKISRFFPSPPQISFFFRSLWRSVRGIVAVVQGHDNPLCSFGRGGEGPTKMLNTPDTTPHTRHTTHNTNNTQLSF